MMNDIITLIISSPLALSLLIVWSLAWKGVALWKSARRGNKKWFVALLVINTAGILEMVYIFIFSKKKKGDFPAVPPENINVNTKF